MRLSRSAMAREVEDFPVAAPPSTAMILNPELSDIGFKKSGSERSDKTGFDEVEDRTKAETWKG
jgi:hypothetical protein